MNDHSNILDEAKALDDTDPLRSYRERFHIPVSQQGKEKIYFCGNSLGLQPKEARSYVEQEMKDWERLGVDGHTHAGRPWMPYHEFLTDQMASLVGALPQEVVVMNSLTVNLHLMMVSFYRPTRERFRILIEKGAFPSDRYAVVSQLAYHGYDPGEGLIEIAPRPGENSIRKDDLLDAIRKDGDSIALVMIGNVNYYSGQAFDMKVITDAGHERGCIVAFDLAHGAGNIACALHDSGADFAVWCSYKYLNAGPGGLSGCFVHERHAERQDLPRFAGWWGHEKSSRFRMGPDFVPIPGAEGWQLSNPPILPMATLKASLDIFGSAGMEALRSKSVAMSSFLLRLLDNIGSDRIETITPSDPEQRGCQLSIRVQGGDKTLFQRLTAADIVSDWREPDVIRIAPVPLYNRFEELVRFAVTLEEHLEAN